MKKIISILALTLLAGAMSLVKAQDVIIMSKGGSKILAEVIEIGINDIKYILFDDLSEKVRSLPKSEIYKIEYEDGTMEVFGTLTRNRRNQNQNQNQNQDREPNPSRNRTQYRNPYGNRTQPSRGRSDTRQYYYDDEPEDEYRSYPSDYRKGYIGISAGASILQEDYYLENGVQVTINAGYLFGRHVGITGSFLYTSYDLTKKDNASIGLIGGLIGPLFSFSNASQKVAFDIRPTIGYVSIHGEIGNQSETTDESALALGLGGTARWNVSRTISLTGNLDYIRHSEFEDYDIDFASVGITFGVNFRF
ncbi:MAG: porin family protein [Tannerella sp.]|nr:porin family protein [Tannerella sp.]